MHVAICDLVHVAVCDLVHVALCDLVHIAFCGLVHVAICDLVEIQGNISYKKYPLSWVIKQLFHTFLCNSQNYTPSVLWMT